MLPRIFETLDHLRSWLKKLPDGKRIVSALPGGNAGEAQLIFAVADILQRWGFLGAKEFWDSLDEAAPMILKPEVASLRALFKIPPGVTPDQAPAFPPMTASAPSTAADLPSTIVVLLASASPVEADRLQVDKEFRKIIEKIRGTRFRDRFRFVQVPATRLDDLLTALQEHEPHILHISSHGDKDGSLKFEGSLDDDDDGVVSKAQLLRMLKALRDNLRMVLINACHSEVIVRDIPPNIDVAIGMNTTLLDSSAISFAASFYESLGFGRTVETAFEVALAKLKAIDDDIPQLYPPAAQDPDNKRKLKLIQP